MAKETSIEYCDTTVNAVMGCSGCELWNPRNNIFHCFAGRIIAMYNGLPGFPDRFGEPRLFEERIQKAIKLPDLTGTERPDKPWLNGYPRIIFLNDLGETFDPTIPLDWLRIHFDDIRESKHIWLVLTKQATRMRLFFSSLREHEAPINLLVGVSVTSQDTVPRLKNLYYVGDHVTKWVSFEPLLSQVTLPANINFQWAVVGGGSNMACRTRRAWILDLIIQLQERKIPVFFKQYGSIKANPYRQLDKTARENGGSTHGGSMLYSGYYLREMPLLLG